jgi:hypothetical protein
MRIRSIALPLVAAIVLAACDVPPTAPAPSNLVVYKPLMSAYTGEPIVPGNYTDADVRIISPFNPSIIDRYTYWAERTADGRILGRFTYKTTLLSGPVTVTGKVLCFTILGPTARLGGVVTSTTNSDIAVGSELTWSVADLWEKDGDLSDQASPLLGAPAEPYCALGLPYPQSPLERGYVWVEYELTRK